MWKPSLFILLLVNAALFFYFIVTNSYPTVAIASNVLSILILGGVIVPIHKLNSVQKYKWDLLSALGLFLIALLVCFYKIDVVTPGIQGDEVTVAMKSQELLRTFGYFPFDSFNFGHPTPLLYLTGLSIEILGKTILAIRAPYVIIGSLSIALFYVLLRFFFNKRISLAAALLMLFSYPFIIISRLAYEITPQLFFQILSMIFVYLAWAKKDNRYFLAVGLSLGLGLYTYVGFRTFISLVLALVIYIIHKRKEKLKSKLLTGAILIAGMFIAATPLFSYTVGHSDELMARSAQLSAFNQGFSASEVSNEIIANAGRLSRLFFMGDPNIDPNGDNNFRNNPSNVSMFDFGTFILLLAGFILLFRYNKKLFLIVVLLALSPLINDIFVIERIPEAMHPNGVGHPNTLRIAGIIPIIFFIIAYGLERMRIFLRGKELNFFNGIFVLLGVIMMYNYFLYYSQPTDKFFSYYIYRYNGAFIMSILDTLHKNNVKEVFVSSGISSDIRFSYFSNGNIKVHKYNPKTYEEAIAQAKNNPISILSVLDNNALAQQLVTNGQQLGVQIVPLSLFNTQESIYALVLIKK